MGGPSPSKATKGHPHTSVRTHGLACMYVHRRRTGRTRTVVHTHDTLVTLRELPHLGAWSTTQDASASRAAPRPAPGGHSGTRASRVCTSSGRGSLGAAARPSSAASVPAPTPAPAPAPVPTPVPAPAPAPAADPTGVREGVSAGLAAAIQGFPGADRPLPPRPVSERVRGSGGGKFRGG